MTCMGKRWGKAFVHNCTNSFIFIYYLFLLKLGPNKHRKIKNFLMEFKKGIIGQIKIIFIEIEKAPCS